jgi:hypothetical protein
MCRVLSADGILFIRDLARPHDELALKELVQNHAGNESPYSQQLFHQSLAAAFTIPEIHKMIAGLPIKIHSLSMSSNRHWTLVAQKT